MNFRTGNGNFDAINFQPIPLMRTETISTMLQSDNYVFIRSTMHRVCHTDAPIQAASRPLGILGTSDEIFLAMKGLLFITQDDCNELIIELEKQQNCFKYVHDADSFRSLAEKLNIELNPFQLDQVLKYSEGRV